MNRFATMTFILVVYVGIMCLLTLMYGCTSETSHPKVFESDTMAAETTVSITDKVEQALKKSDTSIGNIESTMNEVQVLKKENQELKVELQCTKDSLVATKKLVKKRTLIQKVLGLNKDTIQTTMKDTAN